ncbi:MAG: PKD domain-containing protein [Chitinophagales bacterium]
MKFVKHLHFLLFAFIMLSSAILSAQIVGSDAYMQGTYVEMGINDCGAFAASSDPPSGYVNESTLTGRNFIADSDLDGWDLGTPNYCGDYAIPGSPVEGWGIEIAGSSYYNTDQYCSYFSISGSITSYEAAGDSVIVVWEGSVDGVDIKQTSIIHTDDQYTVTFVELTNASGTDLTDIYYKRNIDPDQEQPSAGTFNTVNTVEANPYLGDPYSIVTAIGEEYGCYLALVANNFFSMGTHGNFSTAATTNVSDSYNGLSGYNLSGSAGSVDQAIQMSFWVPALADGASVVFAFAYVFDEESVDAALEDTYIPGEDPVDVGVVDVISPATGCGLGLETVSIKVFNYGYEEQSDIPVSFRVDGGPIISETLAGPVEPGTFEEYTFTTPGSLIIPGDHIVSTWTALSGDADLVNDTLDVTITNIPILSTFPYYEDFEAGSAGWTTYGTASTWEWGEPIGPVISGPPPATPSSLKSWGTDLDDYFCYSGENSFLQSTCFDFTGLIAPYIEFDIWYDGYGFGTYGYDGVHLQYSLDGGATWDIVDSEEGEDAENWYNAINYSWWTGSSYDSAWCGSSGGWIRAKHGIENLAGESSVQFRFRFGTATWTCYSNDGVAVDNINIQDPYDHDIDAVVIASPFSMPGLTAAESIVVTISNEGINAESGFPVSYQIDGGSVITETFTGTLDVGEEEDFTFATTADLSSVGTTYSIVAWTGLSTDEWIYNDTTTVAEVTHLEPLTGDAAYYVYSNISGGAEPWYYTSNSTAMNTVFGSGGWTSDFFETVDPDVLFGLGTCFVWLEGSEYMGTELETFLDDNEVKIQNWVASGGHLIINAASYEGSGTMDFKFDGVELQNFWYSSYGTATDSEHPIFTCYYLPTGTSWNGFFGYGSIEGGGVTPIIHDFYTTSRYLAAEKTWGAGRVIFSAITPNAFHTPSLEAANLTASTIKYQSVCTLADNDMGLLTISDPADGCDVGLAPVTVKVTNYGFLDQTDVPVSYQIDGGLIITETVPGTIASGETVSFTFTTLGTFTGAGDHTIDAWTALASEEIPSNDSASNVITSYPIITTYPYYEDFEASTGNWFAYGSNVTWEHGEPTGPTISGPPPATPSSLKSWGTDLDDYYYYVAENSYLQGPCYDFSGLVAPYIEFDLWYHGYGFPGYGYDGINVQYSLDGGTSWTIVDYDLGDDNENWYNAINYNWYNPVTFSYDSAWCGNSGGWIHVQHDLEVLAGEPNVQFRFRYGNVSWIGSYDGVALDNINIQDPFADDLGVIAIVSPAGASVAYSSAETVTVTIKNYGIEAQSGFPVNFQVDGGTIYTETYTGTIDVGETADYTFTATEDFSVDGVYEICAWTSLTGDEDATNDQTCESIINVSPVSGTGAYLVYSNITGYEPFYGTEYTDAMDEVFTSYTLDYFETLDPIEVFSEDNCFIQLNGAGDHGTELKEFMDNNVDLVEAWVESGGNLFINAGQYEILNIDLGFDGVTQSQYYYSYDATALDATHPIFVGPYTPVLSEYSGDFMGYGKLDGDYTLLMEEDFSGYDILAEKEWGSGTVLFTNLYTPYYWYYAPTEGMNMHRNMLDYLKLCAPVDVGMTDLIAPESGCGLGDDVSITVEITNFGGTTVTDVPVNYQVGTSAVVTETYPGPLEGGASDTYTFTAGASFSPAGDYDVTVWTSFGGDGNESNDTYATTVTSLETPVIDLGPNQTICDEYIIDAGNPGATYDWSTGASTQTIVVTETGTYSVTVTDPETGCAVTDAITVTVNYSPTASFTYTSLGLSVTFTNTSTGGATYTWDFGDGGSSTVANPTHTYDVAGDYTVTLTVTNSCGTDVYTTTVPAIVAIENTDLANATDIYPNPTSGIAIVDVHYASVHDVTFELVNTLGENVWSMKPGSIQNGTFEIDMRNLADGVYQLKVTADDATYTKQIVLTK